MTNEHANGEPKVCRHCGRCPNCGGPAGCAPPPLTVDATPQPYYPLPKEMPTAPINTWPYRPFNPAPMPPMDSFTYSLTKEQTRQLDMSTRVVWEAGE